MPAAVAIPAIIGAGSSIAQGVIGSRAAKNAAKTQADAAERVRTLANLAGERGATDVTAAGERAAGDIATTGENVATSVEGASRDAATATQTAAGNAAAGYRISADEANEILRSIYGDSVAQLSPYREAGGVALNNLTAAIQPGGDFNHPFTAAEIQMDPGYAFRLQEGQKALERSAAARGTLASGGTLKALARYSQGVASDEFGKAFERFRADRNDRASTLANLAGLGFRATESGINAGENYGNRASGNVMASGEAANNILYRGATDAADYTLRGVDSAGRIRLGSTGDSARIRLGSVGDAARIRLDAARQEGSSIEQGANARASGTVGNANAWAHTLGNLGNLAADVYSRTRRPRNTDSMI